MAMIIHGLQIKLIFINIYILIYLLIKKKKKKNRF